MFDLTRTTRRRIAHGVSYVFLVTVGITMVFPLFWMVVTSLKTPAEPVLDPSEWWPRLPWRVGKSDVRNWPILCRRLIEHGGGTSAHPLQRIWQPLDKRSRETVVAVSKRDPRPVGRREKLKADQVILESEKGEILAALNGAVENNALADAPGVERLALPDRAGELRAELRDHPLPPKPTADQKKRYQRPQRLLNRFVLDACLPDDLVATHRLHWENYRTVIVEINFARAFFNSALVTLSVTFGMVFTSSLAAFAFARLNFFARDKIFLGYLATLMIPGAVTMIPVFLLMRELRWVNTYYALIFPAMFSAYGTFMLRQFFMSIPRDLEEAALLDGCSTWGIYWNVVLPLSKPALAALSILTFMSAWRGFMWPLIVSHTRDMFTLPVALAAFRGLHGIEWTLMMAGSVIMIVPMLVAFIIGQRYFIEGIRLGAIKG